MDYQMWRSNHHKQTDQSPDSVALPLFAPEPNKSSNVSVATNPITPAFTESTPLTSPKLVGYFSLSQLQELELQSLIYKYIRAGASVPLELILPLRRSLINETSYHQLSRQYQHHQPAVLQSGYWGRHTVDHEPGRCRRTDGKKWRCSKDVVAGQRYCERHVHRGKNRSRKLVEVPKPAPNSGLESAALPSPLLMTKDTHFLKSEPSTIPSILPIAQNLPGDKTMDGYLKGSLFSNLTSMQWERPEGQVLRRFMDERPKCDEPSSIISSSNAIIASGTELSISISGNSSSDFSLKLSTGNGSDSPADKLGDERVLSPACNWVMWGRHGETCASVGGPLAEVLRPSSAFIVSPKSVLWKPKGSASRTSSTST